MLIVGETRVDQSDWYEFENPGDQYTFTIFRDASHEAMNIVADRWGIRDGVLHFHQGPWRNYSISIDRVRWIRRNW